jgi:hypothetical protein
MLLEYLRKMGKVCSYVGICCFQSDNLFANIVRNLVRGDAPFIAGDKGVACASDVVCPVELFLTGRCYATSCATLIGGIKETLTV